MIKVERPGVGDIARYVGVMVNGMSSLYLVCNRGKRSIAVDLQKPVPPGKSVVAGHAAFRYSLMRPSHRLVRSTVTVVGAASGGS